MHANSWLPDSSAVSRRKVPWRVEPHRRSSLKSFHSPAKEAVYQHTVRLTQGPTQVRDSNWSAAARIMCAIHLQSTTQVDAAASRSAGADIPCLRHSAGRPCLTAGEAEVLTVLKQAGTGPESSTGSPCCWLDESSPFRKHSIEMAPGQSERASRLSHRAQSECPEHPQSILPPRSLDLQVAPLLPFLAMRVVFAGSAVFLAQIRASHAAIDQMKRLNLIFCTESVTYRNLCATLSQWKRRLFDSSSNERRRSNWIVSVSVSGVK